jgi:hypothetical protein
MRLSPALIGTVAAPLRPPFVCPPFPFSPDGFSPLAILDQVPAGIS